jgi:hypothetical protein
MLVVSDAPDSIGSPGRLTIPALGIPVNDDGNAGTTDIIVDLQQLSPGSSVKFDDRRNICLPWDIEKCQDCF